jgi:hypothetical protein
MPCPIIGFYLLTILGITFAGSCWRGNRLAGLDECVETVEQITANAFLPDPIGAPTLAVKKFTSKPKKYSPVFFLETYSKNVLVFSNSPCRETPKNAL